MKIFPLSKPYSALLDKKETERAIVFIKDLFQKKLTTQLNLMRVTAPLFVRPETGINDDLNGVERPVSFPIKDDKESKAVIVHSLAKWKRMALASYGCKPHEGICTNMNAIRADEELDNTHSLYVDQWDWEMVINPKDRTLDFLKKVVTKIYKVIWQTERVIAKRYPTIAAHLPKDIYFIHAEELEAMYPLLTPKEREHEICKKHGAVFLIGIGGALESGLPHDGRAPDYDDWSTPTHSGFKGLNGDILMWHPILEDAFELSSMGIRVDKRALMTQLALRGKEYCLERMFHRMLMDDKLPLSIGGGIGQSRLCMYLLRTAHIGQVHASIWPEEMISTCEKRNIFLL